MIKYTNPMGKISLTNEFFEGLVGQAIAECYGVVGTISQNAADSVKSMVLKDDVSYRGVHVAVEDNRLVINLHVRVLYGINVAAICDNVRERVIYAVENCTDLKVKRINISIDDIVTE